MSRSKGTLPLAVTFAVLLTSSIAVEFLGGPRFGAAETRRALEPLFPGFQTLLATRLSIEGPAGQSVDLHRRNETWYLGAEGSRTADPEAVRRALEELDGLPQGRVVTSGDGDLTRYGLEGPEAIRVRVLADDGRTLAALVVGAHQDYRATFLRREDEDSVRRIEATVRRSFRAPGATGWRDRTILASGDPDAVQRITIDGPTRMVFDRVSRDGDGDRDWVMSEPRTGPALRWMIDGMATFLSGLECDRFFDGAPDLTELGLDPPDLALTAEVDGAAATVLHVGQTPRDGRRPVKRPDDDSVWWIQAFRVDTFLKPPETYLVDPDAQEPDGPEPGDGDALNRDG